MASTSVDPSDVNVSMESNDDDGEKMKTSSEAQELPAFYFKRRRGRIDWRKLDRVDLDQLVNEVDIDTLQEHVDHIAFADVGEDGKMH